MMGRETKLASVSPRDVLRLARVLPRGIRWVGQTVEAHAEQARPVASFGFDRLGRCYPAERLASARAVVVDEVPMVPFEQWGLGHLAGMGPTRVAGITFGETFFVRRDAVSEHLFFHELVHVVQWRTLGFGRFGLLYGVGLAEHGYRGSPLEAMAYDLTARFDAGETPDAEAEAAAATLALGAAFRRRGLHTHAAWAAARAVRPHGWRNTQQDGSVP